ncbi:MAG: hypothetical protein JKY02_05295 [Flavobacteriaceae bacterium]|nr:hypothetical protein [Flavobacteriaceae bacterium]
MKKLKFILPVVAIFIACSENDPDISLIDNSTPVLRTFSYKTYNSTTNAVNRTTVYTLQDNKMVSSTTSTSALQQNNTTYSYSNNQISVISTLIGGNLSSQQSYSYNGNNKLIEYLHEYIHPTTQQSFFNRHTFTHTTDTIFSEWKQSSDGMNFNDLIATYKIVLDNNSNRTYFEKNDLSNNEINVRINRYDINDNLIAEDHLIKDANNVLMNSQSTTITHETSLNLLSLVYQNTYGKETLMLLYHLLQRSTPLNYFASKAISNNSFKTFNATFVGNSQITFEFMNETGTNNYDYLNEYRTYNDGVLFSRFTVEFTE